MALNNKKIAFFLGHPAHFHLFKNLIENLQNDGYHVDLLIKRKDILEELVINSGHDYYVVRKQERTSSSKLKLIWSVISMDWKIYRYLMKNKPKLLMGTVSTIISSHAGIPIVVCNEDDAAIVPRFVKISYPRASVILNPSLCDSGKWNDKAIKYQSYHKLAYLHPNRFTPDKKIVQKYFNTDKPYFLMRFAKLSAHHDDGIRGISVEIANHIIGILSKNGDVYITSERPIDKSLEKYRLHINPADIHHVMAYSSLYVGDGQSMAIEAAMLGIPSIRFNDFAGRIGVLEELEHKYELTFGFKTTEPDKMYEKIQELLAMPDLKEKFESRRQRMLSEKIDVTAFFTWFVENYPDSIETMKNDSNYQYKFR